MSEKRWRFTYGYLGDRHIIGMEISSRSIMVMLLFFYFGFDHWDYDVTLRGGK